MNTPFKTKEPLSEGKDNEPSETNGNENGHEDKKEVENEVEGKANEAEEKNDEKSSDKENEVKSPEKTKEVETKDNEETAVKEITPASDQNGDQVRNKSLTGKFTGLPTLTQQFSYLRWFISPKMTLFSEWMMQKRQLVTAQS